MFIYTWIDSRKKRQKKRQKKNFFGIEEYRETYLLSYKQFKFQIFLICYNATIFLYKYLYI